MLNRLTFGLALTLASVASGQTIVNGDFESGLQNWMLSGFAVSTHFDQFRCGRALPTSTAFGVETVSGQPLTLDFVPLVPRSSNGARFIDIATCDQRPTNVDFYLGTRIWKTIRLASPGSNLVHRESVPLEVSILGQPEPLLIPNPVLWIIATTVATLL